jgi:hypothetical protein
MKFKSAIPLASDFFKNLGYHDMKNHCENPFQY